MLSLTMRLDAKRGREARGLSAWDREVRWPFVAFPRKSCQHGTLDGILQSPQRPAACPRPRFAVYPTLDIQPET